MFLLYFIYIICKGLVKYFLIVSLAYDKLYDENYVHQNSTQNLHNRIIVDFQVVPDILAYNKIE